MCVGAIGIGMGTGVAVSKVKRDRNFGLRSLSEGSCENPRYSHHHNGG